MLSRQIKAGVNQAVRVAFLLITCTSLFVAASGQSVTVTSIQSMPLCHDESTCGFSAHASGIPGNLTYTWFKNGVNVQSDQQVPFPYRLTLNSVSNADTIYCVVTSDAVGGLVQSNIFTVTTTQGQTFTAGISAMPLTYCAGDNVTFTAVSNLSVATYQWTLSGQSIGNANSNTYTVGAISADQLHNIGVTLTTNAGCVVNNTASWSAQNLQFQINPQVTPAVSITADGATTICSGTAVTFTANPVNGGTSPSYQWLVNGAVVSGVSGSTFTTNTLTDGQHVSCVLNSNAPCAAYSTATSNVVTMAVNPAQSVSVAVTGPTTVCQFSPASFHAHVFPSAGPNTIYQWKKNGVAVSSDDPNQGIDILVQNAVADNDVFTCTITSDLSCAVPVVATSNAVTVAVTPRGVFNVHPNPSGINLCIGDNVTFTASSDLPMTGGFVWMINGEQQGEISNTLVTPVTSADLLKTITVMATTTSTCVNSQTAVGKTDNIPFIVNPKAPPAVSYIGGPLILGQPATLTAVPVNGGTPYYQWQVNGKDVPGANGTTFTTTINEGEEYQTIGVVMNSSLPCSGTAAFSDYVQVVSSRWENLNYVRVHEVQVPGITDWVAVDKLPIGQQQQTTTYLDGMGRPIQKVDREASSPQDGSSQWLDIVQPTNYDQLGRQAAKYLPYVTNAQLARFKTTSFTDQAAYYTANYNESPAYDQITYESTEMNRVANSKESGSVWAASPGVSTAYELNDKAADDVRIWTIGYNPTDYPVCTGSYESNALFRNTYKDEKGRKVVVYLNNTGQVILKKTQLDDNPSSAHAGWICVYTIYDDFGQVRFVLQPEAVKYLEAHSWKFDGMDGQAVLNEYCFKYTYDDKGRVTQKKAPGSKDVFMLYDKRDRLAFDQDGVQRGKTPAEWHVTLYDELDRPVLNGLYLTSGVPVDLQTNLDNAGTTTSMTIPELVPGDLVVANRDQSIRAYIATNSVNFVDGFGTVDNDDLSATVDPNATTGTLVTVTAYSNTIPAGDISDASKFTPVRYNYYDDYTYAGAKPFNSGFSNSLAYPDSDPTTLPIVRSERTLNLPTGTKVRVLGSTTFLTTSMYYDEKGRPIQMTEDNIKSGVDITTNQYHFDGRLLSSDDQHSAAGTAYTNFDILTKYVYDQGGRVIALQEKYGTNDFKTVASYDLDGMGRMRTRHLDPGYTGTGKSELESLSYSYNIHNQITGINKDYALKTPGKYNKWGNFFGLYLGYDNKDNVFGGNQLSGQVTGSLWTTQGDDAQRKYDLSYDNAGRLINATFNEKATTDDTWNNAKMDFSVSGRNGKIEYDLNGNLLYLLQKGIVPGTQAPVVVDDLQYKYTLSNKLQSVTDNSPLGALNGKLGDFADGTNGSTDDYMYDDNGNLITDLNKNATGLGGSSNTRGISYNYLDKPEFIHIGGKGTIQLVYDADGNKLQKIFTPENGGAAIVTSYINGFIYRGDDLQYINFEEGRVRVMQTVNQNNGYDLLTMDGNMDLPGGTRGAYDFFVKDYQNNIRMILTEEVHTGSNSCTMETSRAANEEPLFGPVDASGKPTDDNEVKARFPVASIPGQTVGGGWQNAGIGEYVSRIGNLAGHKIGPNALLKVMAGDQISAQTQYYYQNPVTNSSGGATLVTDLLASLASAISGSSATSSLVHPASGDITSALNTSVPFSATTDPDAANATGNAPKAYLTVLFFDERFNFVPENSIYNRVSQSGSGAAPLQLPPVKAPKNGYAYVYVSNESDEMVYFDNLQVANQHGAIMEEDHYYAYGLKIAGISSRELPDPLEGATDNKFLYNEKELIDEADLNWYNYGFRNYDPQIGRFTQLDPLTDDYSELTPYQYASCDPITNIDVDGLEGAQSVEAAGNAAAAATTWGDGFKDVTGFGHQILGTATVTAPLKTAPAAQLGSKALSVAAKVADGVTDFIPFVSSGKDIFFGLKNGNWWQVGMGVAGLGLDFFTMGGSSIAKGVIKTTVKEAIEVVAKGEAEQLLKRSIVSGATTETEQILKQSIVKTAEEGTEKAVTQTAKDGLSNYELVQKAATKAENALGGIGKRAGTAKHAYATELLERYQARFGDRGLRFGVDIGKRKGFLDVIDHANKIIYDFKFGKTLMKRAQFLKYAKKFPDYLIQVIKP